MARTITIQLHGKATGHRTRLVSSSAQPPLSQNITQAAQNRDSNGSEGLVVVQPLISDKEMVRIVLIGVEVELGHKYYKI